MKTHPHCTDEELKKILDSQTNPRAHQDWLIIYSVQKNPGREADEFAAFLCVNKYKILRVIQSYNKLGVEWRSGAQWGGRREAGCVLTLEDEAGVLEGFEGKAAKGEVLIYKEVKEAVEQKVGREVSDDYVWDMFKRHGWTKKVPQQSHPKGSDEEREDFKKNSRRNWNPSR